jgi:two-component system, response regulator PdtaR
MDKTNSTHILVVDDDRLVLASLARGLRNAGYRVSEASTGEDALEITARDRPDLALLDVRMPGMDGIELGSILAERNGVPFLYLSAYGQPDIVQQAASHGALGYLVKPLDISQILPSIETALSRSVERDRLRESEANLNSALAGKRETDLAIGLLMERRRLDRHQAFEMLRSHARSERRTIVDAARELVDSIEKINALPEPVKPARRKRTVKGSRSSPG